MALVKAVIEVLDREAVDPTKGVLPFIPVQFNPTEYTITKTNTWNFKEVQGQSLPPP